jgi:hypothetical protein
MKVEFCTYIDVLILMMQGRESIGAVTDFYLTGETHVIRYGYR